jgi:hypothetical protein
MAAAFVASLFSQASSAAPPTDRKPTFSYSVAHDGQGRQANGPLFQKVVQALDSAKNGNAASLGRYLTKDASLKLMVHGKTGSAPETLPLGVETIRAAFESCLGPYSYDEGASWAQLSWICRVDAEAPLSKIMSFRDSPELTLTVWFAADLIKEIVAMEPLPVPGERLVSMNAYEVMTAKP